MAAEKHNMHGGEVTYEKMSASLGSLLLLWARIEKTFRDDVERRNGGRLPKSAYRVSGVFDAWKEAMLADQARGALIGRLACTLREQLQAPLAIRNGLCHGLMGISSAGNGCVPTLTWELNGETHSVTYQALQQSFQWLSKVPNAVAAISSMSDDDLGTRVTDTAENRDWWRGEYGLSISKSGWAL